MLWQLQPGILSRAALDAAAGAALSIGGTPVTTATVGTAYAGFTVTAAGGTSPYTYSVASGALPAGITLNSSSGAVSGTPTTAGTYASIVIRATDAASATADLASFTITVGAIVSGMIGWWDASVFASLSLSGSNITAIADQSGGGRTMTSVGPNHPVYNATGFNSKPAMMWGSPPQNLLATASGFPMGTGNTLTAWQVATMANGATSNSDARSLNYVASGATKDYDNDGSWIVFRAGGSSQVQTFYRNGTSAATAATITAYPAPHRFIYTVNSSGLMTVYVDGVSSATATKSGNWVSNGIARMGNLDGSSANWWGGIIAEAGIATGYSDATAVAALDTYLKNKWGL